MTNDPSQTLANITEFTAAGPSGSTAKLAALTSFSWDQAYWFNTGTAKADIDRVTGLSVDFDDETVSDIAIANSFIIFLSDRKVTAIMASKPPLYLNGKVTQAYEPSSAEVVVSTKDPGPYSSAQLR